MSAAEVNGASSTRPPIRCVAASATATPVPSDSPNTHDPLRRHARGGKGIGRFRVGDQTRLGRAAGRAAVAAIAQRNEAVAIAGKRAEAIGAIAQRAAVAVEVEHQRLARPSAARTRRSPSRRRRCRARSPAHRTGRPPPAACAARSGMIHQRALRDIHQRDESAERRRGRDEPFQKRHDDLTVMHPRGIDQQPLRRLAVP